MEETDPLAGTLSTVDFDEVVGAEDAAEVADEIAERPDVVWAVPNTMRRASRIPAPVTTNDPKFRALRHLWDGRSATSGAPSPWPRGGYSIKAPSLWRATKGSSSVVVAVLDTGITAHPDLDDQVIAGRDFVSDVTVEGDTQSNDRDGTPGWDADARDPGDWTAGGACGDPTSRASDSSWHGTHVAGIVAAEAGNRIGVAGAAPGVKIQPIRVLGPCGGWDSDIASAVIWAAGGRVTGLPANPSPAKVINLSLAATYLPDAGQDDSDAVAAARAACMLYDDAIGQARARGALTVVAAGNEIAPAEWAVPASCAGAFTVGSTGLRGLAAWYSNYGDVLDISAPGGDRLVDANLAIMSTMNTGTKGPAKATYERMQGTSMATPAVAGGAALLYSLGLSTPAQVEAGLRAAARDFPAYDRAYARFSHSSLGAGVELELNCALPGEPADAWCGDGILDLGMVQANISAPAVSGSARIGQTLKPTGSWNASALGLRYQWLRDGNPISGATSATYVVKPTHDLGKRLSVRVSPGVAAYAGLARTTAQTKAVQRASSTTSISLTSSVSRTSQATVTVQVRPVAAGPTGRLTVYDGSKVIARADLVTSNKGRLAITLPRLAKGKHKIKVKYAGDANASASTSKTTTISSK